jgi:4-diphosphocytidyl-2-C-methyl-D-erythritol kinase
MVTKTAFAPAKVNLFLHVASPDADGMHPLCSLMAFADIGDRITLEPADTLSLSSAGPFGAGLPASDDNLVLRAARALLALPGAGMGAPGFRLILDKQLPIASGLGGGSSDAGAALRLVRDAVRPDVADAALVDIAGKLGSDGPACLFARPVIAEGRGERLTPAPVLPRLDAVLVNPGVASPTGEVYRRLDAMRPRGAADRPAIPKAFEDMEAVAEWLRGLRNDLEPPAIAVNPVVGEALAALSSGPGTRLARVSGSGATCFALCADEAAAATLAARVSRAHPGWWVRPCCLGGPWT